MCMEVRSEDFADAPPVSAREAELTALCRSLFGVNLTSAEVEAVTTMAEFVRLIEFKIAHRRAEGCTLGGMLDRLRDSGAIPEELCHPEAAMSDIAAGRRPHVVMRDLSRASGLRLPPTVSPCQRDNRVIKSSIVLLLGVGSLASIDMALLPHGIAAAMFIVAWCALTQRDYARGARTLGELLAASMHLNLDRAPHGELDRTARERRWVLEGIWREFGPPASIKPARRRSLILQSS